MAIDFGTDTSCTTGLRTGRMVSGARLVAEAVYRRITTPRGMLRGGEEEADYGIDILDLIGSAQTAADRAALPGRIQLELLKDPRVLDVTVSVVATTSGPATEFAVTIEGGTAAGPFRLRAEVTDVTLTLLGIETEA